MFIDIGVAKGGLGGLTSRKKKKISSNKCLQIFLTTLSITIKFVAKNTDLDILRRRVHHFFLFLTRAWRL